MNRNLPLPKFTRPENLAAFAYNYQQWREQFILLILQFAVILGIILIAFSFSAATFNERILFIGLYVVLFGITAFPVPYTVRSYTFLGALFLVGLDTIIVWGPWNDGSIFFLAFTVMAALLLDNRTDVVSIFMVLLSFVIVGTLQQFGISQITAPIDTTLSDWLQYTSGFLVTSVAITAAIYQFKREFTKIIQKMQELLEEVGKERALIEERMEERTRELEVRTAQLHSSSVVARAVAESQNISDLMETLTSLIAEQFGHYHIGLYLLDENKKTAFLQAASSAAGKELIGQGFHIEPNRRNPLYIVVDQNHFHIISDIGVAGIAVDTTFPRTRSRITLPLTTRGNVLGMLDIHSEQPDTFSAHDAEIMQTLADLAAISIDNVRLINEAKNLASQLASSVSFQARETWSKLTSRHTPAYQYTPAGVRPIFQPKKEGGSEGLHIPLLLHGQNIGTIKLRRKGVSSGWSERERALVEKISEQVSLALENSRLVDEAQKNALRDKMIASFSSRVRETLDIESVARTAATELRKIFDLKEAEISIGSS